MSKTIAIHKTRFITLLILVLMIYANIYLISPIHAQTQNSVVTSAPEDPPHKEKSLYGIMFKNTLIPETVLLPSGSFNMGQSNVNLGCRTCSKDEQPIHKVEISTFEIGRFEVTNSQYLPFALETGRDMAAWRQFFTRGHDNFPVISISWSDAQAYCAWLQALTGRAYRLPTEAEWEYAARANSINLYILRNDLSGSEANFGAGINERNSSVQVGRYKPNRFGLYDMLGNAWEWCSDWYNENYYSESPTKDPQGPSDGQYRVLRGGGWQANSDQCRVAKRFWYNTGYALEGRGLRVAVTLAQPKSNTSSVRSE